MYNCLVFIRYINYMLCFCATCYLPSHHPRLGVVKSKKRCHCFCAERRKCGNNSSTIQTQVILSQLPHGTPPSAAILQWSVDVSEAISGPSGSTVRSTSVNNPCLPTSSNTSWCIHFMVNYTRFNVCSTSCV